MVRPPARVFCIKGGTHIETAAHIDTIIFDKTGTLTAGEPTVNQFIKALAGNAYGEEECLRIAASAEQHTTHPLGLALVKEAKKRGLDFVPVQTHKSHPGLGVSATVEGKQIHIGNRRFMDASNVNVEASFESKAFNNFVAGESLLYFSVDQELHGIFVVQRHAPARGSRNAGTAKNTWDQKGTSCFR